MRRRPNQAVLYASAVGNAFLKFRRMTCKSRIILRCNRSRLQVSQANQRVHSIDAQAWHSCPASRLHPRRSRRSANSGGNKPVRHPRWTVLQAGHPLSQTTTKADLTAALDRSQVLSVTPLPSSKKKKFDHLRCHRTHRGTCPGPDYRHRAGHMSDRLRRRMTSPMRSTLPSGSVSAHWAHAAR